MTTPAWIGLGSNLGDREAAIRDAVGALAGTPGVAVESVSSYRETSPVGGPPGQGPFLNAAARLRTSLGPEGLLDILQGVEERAGRVRAARWGERTLDADLLIYDALILDTPRLTLPHPRLALRRFALAPLAEIDPTLVEPVTGRAVADLLANLDRLPRLLSLDGSPGRKATVFRRLVEGLSAVGIEGGDDSSERLIRRAESLQVGRCSPETIRAPWIVADYCLALDLSRASAVAGRWFAPRSVRVGEPSGDRNRMHRAREALPPTLVVVLPGGGEIPRAPGLLPTPLLRPESDEPDAIVAEILATCRGIEGGVTSFSGSESTGLANWAD